MGATTEISWTDSTFNSWWGCTKVSEACKFCYAEAFSKRTGHEVWGPSSRRRFFGEKHWNEPRRWNDKAAKAGMPHRVFCSSMADVFERLPLGHDDERAMDEARARLWTLIEQTPALTWQLLTKRPENMRKMVPEQWADGWPRNVWAGTTVEDRRSAHVRLPHLVQVPASTRFMSAEPLLEAIDVSVWLYRGVEEAERGDVDEDAVHQVIVGGESGPGARPFAYDWARDLLKQCRAASAAFFFKQAGAKPTDATGLVKLRNRKGGDLDEIPRDLRVREFPWEVRT